VRQYPPRQHFGIVVLSMPAGAGSGYIRARLEQFLAEAPGPLERRLFVVERDRIRVRD
jgi:hypothetical protein